MGRRAQRIPSWPGVIHSNKGRIHLRRPTCDILTFRLRRRGGPYIPVCPLTGINRDHFPYADFWPAITSGLPVIWELSSGCFEVKSAPQFSQSGYHDLDAQKIPAL